MSQYFITYNRNDYVIWGIGANPPQSNEDAAKNINSFHTNHPRIGVKPFSDRNSNIDLAIVEATESLYLHINREGYHSDLNWTILNVGGKRMAYMLPNNDQIVGFLRNYTNTINFIGGGKMMMGGEPMWVVEAIAILKENTI